VNFSKSDVRQRREAQGSRIQERSVGRHSADGGARAVVKCCVST
jgi:hypothetical protein